MRWDGKEIAARTVLLATGLIDESPKVEGLGSGVYDGAVRFCPICDGDLMVDCANCSVPAATVALNIPRPWVAATRVVPSIQNNSSVETEPGPSFTALHVTPPSMDAKTPTSVLT